MGGEFDYFKKIDNITSKYFGFSLSDIPIPSKVFPINGKDGFLIGSKEALKEQYLVQGQIYKFLEYAPDGYFLTGFWGHGFNSYAFYYSRSDLKLRYFSDYPMVELIPIIRGKLIVLGNFYQNSSILKEI